MTLCRLVSSYQGLGRASFLHLQSLWTWTA